MSPEEMISEGKVHKIAISTLERYKRECKTYIDEEMRRNTKRD